MKKEGKTILIEVTFRFSVTVLDKPRITLRESVQTRNFFWFVISHIWTEYGHLLCESPLLAWM